MTEKNSQIPLGKDTDYPKAFDASVLFAIARNQAREALRLGRGEGQRGEQGAGQRGEQRALPELPFVGYDEWTLYELSWLDSEGSPQVAIGLLRVPADSESIVESKSLKLYANGLYYKRFSSSETLINQVTADLNQLLNCQVQFSLFGLEEPFADQNVQSPAGYQSLDHCQVKVSQGPDVGLLSGTAAEGSFRYQTRRFRSLCPVTGQPDWASIYINLEAVNVDACTLAQYLAGFSEHQGFHENCVERIYIELQRQLKPAEISVAARYTRRGGIDINPIRASSVSQLRMPPRELRQ